MPYKNPEDAKKRQKECHVKNPTKRKQQWAAWHARNVEHNRTRQERYAPQKREYAKNNYAINKSTELQRNREYIKKYPERHAARVEKRSFFAALHLRTAARHAKQKGVPFELQGLDFISKLQRILDDGVCELSGLPFSTVKIGSRRPFMPSLDRMTPELGYTTENVRVVLWALNAAMGTWGLDVLIDIVDGIKKNKEKSPRR